MSAGQKKTPPIAGGVSISCYIVSAEDSHSSLSSRFILPLTLNNSSKSYCFPPVL